MSLGRGMSVSVLAEVPTDVVAVRHRFLWGDPLEHAEVQLAFNQQLVWGIEQVAGVVPSLASLLAVRVEPPTEVGTSYRPLVGRTFAEAHRLPEHAGDLSSYDRIHRVLSGITARWRRAKHHTALSSGQEPLGFGVVGDSEEDVACHQDPSKWRRRIWKSSPGM